MGNELPHSLSFGSIYPTKVSHKFYPVKVSPKKFTQQIYIVPFYFIPRPIPIVFVYSLVRFPFMEFDLNLLLIMTQSSEVINFLLTLYFWPAAGELNDLSDAEFI